MCVVVNICFRFVVFDRAISLTLIQLMGVRARHHGGGGARNVPRSALSCGKALTLDFPVTSISKTNVYVI